MATWPAEVRALAPRGPPLWVWHPGAPPPNFRAVAVPGFHTVPTLAGVLSTRAFRALATRTVRTVGVEDSDFGTHSVPRARTSRISLGQLSWPLWQQHRACRRPAGPLVLPLRLGYPTEYLASPRSAWGYSLRELLSMVAHWGAGWPAGWPCWAGFVPSPDGNLHRRWLVDTIWVRPRHGCSRMRRSWPRSASCSHCQWARSRSS